MSGARIRSIQRLGKAGKKEAAMLGSATLGSAHRTKSQKSLSVKILSFLEAFLSLGFMCPQQTFLVKRVSVPQS